MKPRWCTRCRRELAGADDRERVELLHAAIAALLGVELITNEVERALLKCAKSGATPRRELLVDLVLAELRPRVHAELDRQIAELIAEQERVA